MKNLIIISTIFIFIFSSCKIKSLYDEVDLITDITRIDGHDFHAIGTIDGEPFSLGHKSGEEYNSPINDDETSSGHPFFGTNFTYDEVESNENDINLIFGITEQGNDRMLDVVQVGNSTWYNFVVPSNSKGEAFVKQLMLNGKFYISEITADASQYNDFNITSVEFLEHDENLDDIYKDKIYKVKGNFKAILYNYSSIPNDTIKLEIDDFSALFYDNSL